MPVALISVFDKTGLAAFAGKLAGLGWTLLASGGTAAALEAAGIPARTVESYTGFPEILGGRVKTLHPAIHGGILARPGERDRAELASFGWEEIDLVAVNLYPFEETAARPGAGFDEIIEQIDIGGVALVRAAAKNHARVVLACDPADYPRIVREIEENGTVGEELRRALAVKGFGVTARYDAAIAAWLGGDGGVGDGGVGDGGVEDGGLALRGHLAGKLRYGENPHQRAELYSWSPGGGPLGGGLLRGKELSYNNILDLDAAWKAVRAFPDPAAVVVKHLSPCGVACAPEIAAALGDAVACDPVSAYGGVIALNRPMDQPAAAALGDLFVECIAAPGFDDGALESLSKRRNLRLVIPGSGDVPGTGDGAPGMRRPLESSEIRTVTGGFLRQDIDSGDPGDSPWRTVTAREPGAAEMAALRFAWKACMAVKSNAIVLASGTKTVGIGGGQPNRVDSVRIAVTRAGERAAGSVLASDAFFPFGDSVREAARAGITAIVQPGGSVRDAESIAAADEAGIAMVFTGTRHFRH